MDDLQLSKHSQCLEELPDILGQCGQWQAASLPVLLQCETHVTAQKVEDKAQVPGMLEGHAARKVDEVSRPLGVLALAIVGQSAVHLNLLLSGPAHHCIGPDELDRVLAAVLLVLAVIDAGEDAPADRALGPEAALRAELLPCVGRVVLVLVGLPADLSVLSAVPRLLPLLVLLLRLDHEEPQLVALLRDGPLERGNVGEVQLLLLRSCSVRPRAAAAAGRARGGR
mmetsp:Transcript_85808/g.243306  ORF Transcript_85808/g.243306 Transcript_85808/m.243306 type:complete len:226 (-) Transcript_85808:746-1423(-)